MIYAWVPREGQNPRGCGKTGGMSAHLKSDKHQGRRVATNYGLYCKDADINSAILAEMPEDLRDTSMGADEINTILDSRRGMKGIQLRIGYFIQQTRKRSVDFHYTAPALRSVEMRLVMQTDIIIYCANLGCGRRNCIARACGIITCGIFHYEVYDHHTGRRLGEYWLIGHRDFFDLYDTEEVITDFAEEPEKEKKPRPTRPQVQL